MMLASGSRPGAACRVVEVQLDPSNGTIGFDFGSAEVVTLAQRAEGRYSMLARPLSRRVIPPATRAGIRPVIHVTRDDTPGMRGIPS
jgi:hypothetical protein